MAVFYGTEQAPLMGMQGQVLRAFLQFLKDNQFVIIRAGERPQRSYDAETLIQAYKESQ